MKKSKNTHVLVKRKFIINGVKIYKEVIKHINETAKSELINCPECLERVKNHNDHYEHFSINGRVCSFKTKNNEA